ncbi:MAG TPA: CoA transferase [Hyphomicrobiales bacterium]|nr:CoA transferase [Hyphomicrobiales bacterium]
MSKSQGALSGITVVDLTRVLGGPFCTQILADHGADVIKVEPPAGDETRTWGPPFVDGVSAYFLGVNRNKRGIVLDLSTTEGRDAVLGLLEGADILVENFKTGTMEKWGLGAEMLRARFPRLIHCRISGFGADGPLGGMPGYDAAIQAMSGLMSVNGYADGTPTRIGVPVVDLASGLNAAIGILLALHDREKSGLGQFVESALFDSALSLLHPHMANYFASGQTPGRHGNAHPNVAPYDVFKTKTSPLFLAVGNNGQFRKLCSAIGCPELCDDARFLDNAQRVENRTELKAALEEYLAEFDGADLAGRLLKAGVPCGPVLTVPEAAAHPQTKHREMIVEMDGYRGIASPIKLSRTPASYRLKPPAANSGKSGKSQRA